MRFLSLSCVLLVIAGFAAAQDFPKAEIFAGYSYGNIQVLSDHSNANGWNASVTVNLYKWFGVTSDFGGLYGASATETTTASLPPLPPISETLHETAHVHTFMFGPQFALRRSRLQPFAHFLVGEARTGESIRLTVVGLPGNFLLNTPTSGSASGIAFAAGGGIDYELKRNMAWRVQADYLALGTSNDVRISTGIVFELGK